MEKKIVKILVDKDGNKMKAMFNTTIVGDEPLNGRRAKHYIYKDEQYPFYWHEVLYLSEYGTPEKTQNRIVSERKFFGKYRLIRERVAFRPETWELIAQIVKTMES